MSTFEVKQECPEVANDSSDEAFLGLLEELAEEPKALDEHPVDVLTEIGHSIEEVRLIAN